MSLENISIEVKEHNGLTTVSTEQFDNMLKISNNNSKLVDELRVQLAEARKLTVDQSTKKVAGAGVLQGYLAGYSNDKPDMQVELSEVRFVLELALRNMGEQQVITWGGINVGPN